MAAHPRPSLPDFLLGTCAPLPPKPGTRCPRSRGNRRAQQPRYSQPGSSQIRKDEVVESVRLRENARSQAQAFLLAAVREIEIRDAHEYGCHARPQRQSPGKCRIGFLTLAGCGQKLSVAAPHPRVRGIFDQQCRGDRGGGALIQEAGVPLVYPAGSVYANPRIRPARIQIHGDRETRKEQGKEREDKSQHPNLPSVRGSPRRRRATPARRHSPGCTN